MKMILKLGHLTGKSPAQWAMRTIPSVLLGLLASACGPKIHEFHASPLRACAGDSIEITWRVRGEPELHIVQGGREADAGGPGPFDCTLPPGHQPAITGLDKHGRMTVPAGGHLNGDQDSTRLVIVARKGTKQACAEQGVIVFPEISERTFSADTEPLGPDSVVAVDTLDVSTWEGSLLIREIRSIDRRPLTIEHGGRMVTLSDSGGTSSVFEGLSMAGRWAVKAPLAKGERLGTTLAPEYLEFVVGLRCLPAKRSK